MPGGAGSVTEKLQVFICYRRVDSATAAQWLYDHLQGRAIVLSRAEQSSSHTELDGAPPTEVIGRVRRLENGDEWQLKLLREPVDAMVFDSNDSLVTGGRSLRLWHWNGKPKRILGGPEGSDNELTPDFNTPIGPAIRGLSARAGVFAVLSDDTKLWQFVPPKLGSKELHERVWRIDYLATLPVRADSFVFSSNNLAATSDREIVRIWELPLDLDPARRRSSAIDPPRVRGFDSPRELARMPHASKVPAAVVGQGDLQVIRTATTAATTVWSHTLKKETSATGEPRIGSGELVRELSARLQAVTAARP